MFLVTLMKRIIYIFVLTWISLMKIVLGQKIRGCLIQRPQTSKLSFFSNAVSHNLHFVLIKKPKIGENCRTTNVEYIHKNLTNMKFITFKTRDKTCSKIKKAWFLPTSVGSKKQ